ncbi:MAG: SNF2 family DNA or RNA helicase [Flammeovirgaceae bacterium]|jgi:SNF2 family DNA or RNA helicase
MKTIDNVNERLGDDLRENIGKGSKLSIAAASFSIYAFAHLRKELNNIEELRFVFTSPTFMEEKLQKEDRHFYIPHIFNESELCGGEFELRLKNQLNQRALAKECSDWVRRKVVFKSNTQRNQPLNNLIHLENAGKSEHAYLNVNGFNTADLGVTYKDGFPPMIQRMDFPQSDNYLQWFETVWKDDEKLEEVTEKVQDYFENAYRDNSPEFIYFITLYSIFNDFLEDIASDNLPNEQIGFKDTLIWETLYNFQKDAVIGAINKLETYNGCILADSVGLGKTFSALGVIKYYEMRNKDVLVLCPKKLEANWNTYKGNNIDNILFKDKLNYDVLFHTDLSRESGESNGRQLERVNWGNYGLVVIDESHNFRNNHTAVGRENRYQKLLRKIIQEGIDTKVLMLSATPVNNRFNDLKNQLALAYEGNPAKIDPKLDTDKGVDQIFRQAQMAFNSWSRFETEERTTEKLLDMLDFDFFELLDSLTIARSRKHIVNYYDTSAIGTFPKRNKPIPIREKLTTDSSITYTEIAEQLIRLNLSIYNPLSYLLPSKVQIYADKYDKNISSGTFRQEDREKSLKILMRINLLKRLESSVDSFRITLENVIKKIEDTVQLLSKGTNDGNYQGMEMMLNDESFDWESNWGDEESMVGGKIKVHISDMDKLSWQADLEMDLSILIGLRDKIVNITATEDLKLQKLLSLVDSKISQPINSGNKKVIVFTAFADTANYLYENVEKYTSEKFGLHSALITGSNRKTNAKKIPTELNALLTCFSPVSKNKRLVYSKLNEEIDILIATDCISEGQNLQDCDYLVNYDIHWNPVRIIQRFGRIDRIGSTNESITMVNFWPDVELDAYINLKQKVESKMTIGTMASTGDDNILKADQAELEYRKIQLQKLQDEVVDLEDLKEGVSITDLGLNDFRVDLTNLIREYGELKNVPTGLHAVVPTPEEMESGVVFVLRNINNSVNIDKLNRIHPFYLIYVSEQGEVVANHLEPKKILDLFRLLCKNKKEPIAQLCKKVVEQTKDYRNMSDYSNLLQASISSMIKEEEEKEIDGLFKRNSSVSSVVGKIKGLEDFQIVSFLILK